jgi:FkbM family methyltransferase
MAKLGKVFGFVSTFCGFFLKKRMAQIPFNISYNKEDGLYWITSISQELDFEVLVTDPLYHAPIVFYVGYLYPEVNYWFSGQSPDLPSVRFIAKDKISGKSWELFQNLSTQAYQRRIDAHLNDEIWLGDGFHNFLDNLYKNTQDYIFPEDKSGWFIDLGANLGSYTLLSLALGFKKCLVVEPTESLSKSLRNTFRKFPGVFVEQVAITNLESPFISFNDLSGSEYFTVGNRVILDDSRSDLEKVPNSRLIYLIERYNIQKISLVKIDIEGQEQDVIFGLEDSIWEIIDRIHLEIHVLYGLDSQKIIHYVLSKGFKVLQDENIGSFWKESHRFLLFEKSEKT